MAGGMTIHAEGLAKSFDGGLVTALEHVDLTLAAGERVALTGATGCGKSTLLSLLARLDEPDRGRLELDGVPAAATGRSEAWRAANVGIVFQLHHLLPHLTARENVLLAAARGNGVAADALLARLGLAHRAGTRAAALSGGERQLTALARALVNAPRLLLADEPTGSVDSATGQRILAELGSWSAATGGTLIVATHDRELVAWAEREVRLRDGRTVAVAAGPDA